jgi:hypothetical protein
MKLPLYYVPLYTEPDLLGRGQINGVNKKGTDLFAPFEKNDVRS